MEYMWKIIIMTSGCELETWLWGTKCSSDVQLGGWISSHQWGDCLQLYSIIQQLQKTTEDAWPYWFIVHDGEPQSSAFINDHEFFWSISLVQFGSVKSPDMVDPFCSKLKG